MRKLFIICSFFFLTFMQIQAQNTTVSATVVDSDGTVWANASYRFILYNQRGGTATYNGNPITTNVFGSLSNSGVMSAVVPDNNYISPVGTSWNLSICSTTSAPCSVISNLTITGTSQSITTQINNSLTAPRFSAGPNAFGYSDTEINVVPSIGAGYFNVSSNTQRVWNGSAFQAISGNSGTGTVTNVSGSSANGFTVSTINSGTTPVISVNTDSNHVLPVNTGSSTVYLNGIGTYTTPPNNSAVWGSITGTLNNQTDLQNALNLYCPISGCTFTGVPVLPTTNPTGYQAVNQTYLATNYANLASPTFTGTPTAPTATTGTNTTQIATMAALANSESTLTGVRYGNGAPNLDTAATSTQLVGALNTSPSTQLSTSLIPSVSSLIGAILPVAGAPIITPTANVNALLYTDQLPTEWSGLTGFTITTGQNDENGNPTAALYVPTTTSTLHMVFEDPLIGYTTTTRTITVSVWAKPSGSYSYAYFGLRIEGTGHLDTWFNTSTCATGTVATGVTASVGSVSNGYCQLIETYTIGASSGASAPRLSHVQFAAVSSNGFSPINFYSGDGSSGMYLSHPQMSYTSSVQTYQHVTGPHSYCVAAYNAAGVSSGCSPWVDSPYSTGALNALNGSSEINSITTQAVTGASYCEVFRYGGTTQGALSVSGSTQIACGSTVNDNYLVGDNSTPPAGNATALLTANINNGVNSLPQIITGVDSRSIRTQSEEYYYIYNGAISRIFTAPLGSQGTITQIHVSAFAGVMDPNNTQFSIQCNGGTAQVVSAGMLMKLQGYPIPVSTPKLIINANTTNSSNGPSITISGLEINFTNGCNIDVIQGTTVSNNYWFSEVTWKEGYYLSKPNHANWHAYETPLTAIANQATVNLLPTATVVGGGELEEMTLYFYGTSTTAALYGYLEGDPQVFTDGVLALVANGTEDFFCAGFYSNNGTNSFANGKCGFWINEGITAPAGLDDFLAYRRFDSLPGDQVDFNSNLQVTWENGQAGQNTAVATAGTYKSLVTYWGVN